MDVFQSDINFPILKPKIRILRSGKEIESKIQCYS